MRAAYIFLSLFIGLLSCKPQPKQQVAVYNWLGFEMFTKDRDGKLIGDISWKDPVHIKLPGDSFVFYGNDDSIRFKVPSDKNVDVFKKTAIPAKKWKPVLAYNKQFYFIGTYTAATIQGIYFSFYMTKDRKSLLQLDYSNPGNLNGAMVFSQDSINLLQRDNILIHPYNEVQETESLTSVH